MQHTPTRDWTTGRASLSASANARDPDMEREVRQEIISVLASRELHSLAASVVGLALCGLIVLLGDMPRWLWLVLGVRAVAIVLTRMASDRLRADLAQRRDHSRSFALAGGCLILAAVTWSLFVWPALVPDPLDHATVALAVAGIVGTSLIGVMLGPTRRILFGYFACYLAMTVLGAWVQSGFTALAIPAVLFAAMIAMAMFSLGAARQSWEAAEMIVVNRRLGEELQSALGHAEFLANHDPLTGLLNRRALFEGEMAGAGQARDEHYLLIDLDHFKRINDRFGHDVGDRVLVGAAGAIRRFLAELPGEGHRGVRLGGEEFLAVIAGLDELSAQRAAQSLCERIGRVTLGDVRVSASVGVATRPVGTSIAAALGAADAAMYQAKERGRNCAVSARTGPRGGEAGLRSARG